MMLDRALGLRNRDEMALLSSSLRPGGVFLDIGSNKGEFAIFAASLVGVEGAVLAFEPHPENCYWIRKSITRNGYHHIRLFELALSDQNGVASLYIGEKSGWHSLVQANDRGNKGSISISTRTLDDLLEELGCGKVDGMKIDVEGSEMRVLHGAERVLNRNEDILLLIDVHPFAGVESQAVCAYLQDRGFVVRDPAAPDEPLTSCAGITSLVARRNWPA
jgi:FkbM family methyltransferase